MAYLRSLRRSGRRRRVGKLRSNKRISKLLNYRFTMWKKNTIIYKNV